MNRPRSKALKAALDAWHDNLTPDEQASIPDAPPAAPDESQHGPEGELTKRLGQRELQKAFRWSFIGMGKLPWINSDAEWIESEFEEEARALIDLINRFPFLRVVLRLIAPIASISGFLDKWAKLKEHSRPRGEAPNILRFRRRGTPRTTQEQNAG